MQAWEQFLQQQEMELGTETVQKWLRTLKIQRFDACNLYLEAKDSFQALWFEEHVKSKAQLQLVNGNHKRIKIHISIANNPLPDKKKTKSTKKKKELETTAPFLLHFDQLDPHCLIDNFVLNEKNTLTCKFLSELTSSNEQLAVFNPIFLCGGPGSGKTHWLMGLAHALLNQGFRVIYTRAETFTEHVVGAIRAGEMSLFRQAYRNIDVLLVDDVHVFSRKGATQEEFFHTFNTLHLAGKQIILSANCAPQELQLIEPRLVSRFEWGIVLQLYPLDKNQMIELLKQKAQAFQFPLPARITEFLLETFKSNSKALTKALEAIILRLHLDTQHKPESLSIPFIKGILSDLIVEEEKSTLTPNKIVATIAEQYGIRIEDILGKAQSRECVIPRQLAMHVCRYQLKLPFMKIGELFHRDHSTVMSSVKLIQKALDENDREISSSLHTILKRLQAVPS